MMEENPLNIWIVQDLQMFEVPFENVRQLEIVVSEDRHIKARELSPMLSISVGTVHTAIHSHNAAAQCILSLLTNEQRISIRPLKRCQQGNVFQQIMKV